MIDESATQDQDLTEAEEFASVSFESEDQDFELSESQDAAAAERESASLESESHLADSLMVLQEVDVALVLAVWEPTGDAQVDSALEQLATLDELSVHDHAEMLTSVHSSLHQRLTDISA